MVGFCSYCQQNHELNTLNDVQYEFMLLNRDYNRNAGFCETCIQRIEKKRKKRILNAKLLEKKNRSGTTGSPTRSFSQQTSKLFESFSSEQSIKIFFFSVPHLTDSEPLSQEPGPSNQKDKRTNPTSSKPASQQPGPSNQTAKRTGGPPGQRNMPTPATGRPSQESAVSFLHDSQIDSSQRKESSKRRNDDSSESSLASRERDVFNIPDSESVPTSPARKSPRHSSSSAHDSRNSASSQRRPSSNETHSPQRHVTFSDDDLPHRSPPYSPHRPAARPIVRPAARPSPQPRPIVRPAARPSPQPSTSRAGFETAPMPPNPRIRDRPLNRVPTAAEREMLKNMSREDQAAYWSQFNRGGSG